MAFPSGFVILRDGSPVPSPSFWTLSPGLRICRFLMFILIKSTNLLLNDFVGGDRVECLLCPVRARKKYVARMELYSHVLLSVFLVYGVSVIPCLTIRYDFKKKF